MRWVGTFNVILAMTNYYTPRGAPRKKSCDWRYKEGRSSKG